MSRPHAASTPTQEFDCIVIGAGMAGLAFSTLASARGKRVLLLEQHYLPGGNFTAFKQGPYLFNVAFEWTGPGHSMQKILNRLGVADAYPFEKIDEFKAIVSPQLAKPIRLRAGRSAMEAALCEEFPGEAAQLRQFLDDCVAVAQGTSSSKSIVIRAGIKPVEDMLGAYFKDPLLVHVLYSLVAYPAARGVLLMFIVGAICLDDMWRPTHRDHRRLPSLLYRRIKALGGTVALRTRVAAIEVEEGRARSVTLGDGRRYRADKIVATTDPEQLHRLLHGGAVLPAPGTFAREQIDRAPGLSCFCLFLGLDEKFGALVPDHVNLSLLEATPAWEPGTMDLRTAPLRVDIQSAHYAGMAPKGHASLAVWCAIPLSAFDYWGQGRSCAIEEMDQQRYAAAKQAAADIVLARLERAIPGISACIAARDAATPFTFQRYTLSRHGSVCGHSLASMSYLKKTKNTTDVQNLYHIGHWTTQSGVGTAMQSALDLDHLLASERWYDPQPTVANQ